VTPRLGLVLALVACGSTSGPAPLPAPAPAATPPAATGQVVKQRFHSDALGVDKAVVVYLPAGYDAAGSKHWPVLYYLHGLAGDETNWVEHGKLDRAADELGLDAIVVMPDGDNGFYTDSDAKLDYDACVKDGTGLLIPTQPKLKTCVRSARYETYVTRDLIAWVDGEYRTIATRAGRGIAGLSMGGFGALKLALRHPDLFGAVASHSGIDALLYIAPDPYDKASVKLLDDPKLWGRGLAELGAWVRGIFGDDIATWRANDPATLVEHLAPGTLAIYLDAGTEDDFRLHLGMQYLHDRLLERKIAHEYYLGPGHHNFELWAARVPKSLAFLRAHVEAAH
jgi:S-formylglutathione hydrolase FrmB